jgi:hypothetical protein
VFLYVGFMLEMKSARRIPEAAAAPLPWNPQGRAIVELQERECKRKTPAATSSRGKGT